MQRKVYHTIYQGFVNRKFKVEYAYQKKSDGNYKTLKDCGDKTYMHPAFSVYFGEQFGSTNRINIMSKDYFQFVVLFTKSVKLIQEHLFELFPNMNKTEFEIDTMVLERFITEKAMYVNGMTIIPCTWVNDVDETFAAVQINTKDGSCRVPMEDAIAVSQMFSTFDPHTFGLLMLQMIGYR